MKFGLVSFVQSGSARKQSPQGKVSTRTAWFGAKDSICPQEAWRKRSRGTAALPDVDQIRRHLSGSPPSTFRTRTILSTRVRPCRQPAGQRAAHTRTTAPGHWKKGDRGYTKDKRLVFRPTTKRLEAFGRMRAKLPMCGIGSDARGFLCNKGAVTGVCVFV
jgi:hypothetical protein